MLYLHLTWPTNCDGNGDGDGDYGVGDDGDGDGDGDYDDGSLQCDVGVAGKRGPLQRPHGVRAMEMSQKHKQRCK